jgi:thiamine kinase-like enzyme
MFDTQVFSHNDVQENNCLIDKNERLWLIDYEYSQINFRANDIANYIAENMFAYDEPPAAFVYHPEAKWDLNG